MTGPIGPDTKIGALLEGYPALEPVLISLSPAFGKLRNPVLRRTVAKVATVEQAARMAGLNPRELVLKLREAAGQNGEPEGWENSSGIEPRPEWLHEDRVRARIDGDRILAAGEHPLGRVRAALAGMPPGQILELATPFRPEPLIAVLRNGGFLVYSVEASANRHLTYACRA